VTLDDIRALTGTSKGQIFHYFPGGKEELLLEVARHESERVLDDQQPHLGALTSWAAWDRWRDAVVARYRAQGRNCPSGRCWPRSAPRRGPPRSSASLLERWRSTSARESPGCSAQALSARASTPTGWRPRSWQGFRVAFSVLRSNGEHVAPGGDDGPR